MRKEDSCPLWIVDEFVATPRKQSDAWGWCAGRGCVGCGAVRRSAAPRCAGWWPAAWSRPPAADSRCGRRSIRMSIPS